MSDSGSPNKFLNMLMTSPCLGNRIPTLDFLCHSNTFVYILKKLNDIIKALNKFLKKSNKIPSHPQPNQYAIRLISFWQAARPSPPHIALAVRNFRVQSLRGGASILKKFPYLTENIIHTWKLGQLRYKQGKNHT